MERKIGEIFEYEGNWYQCAESPIIICTDCDFIEHCQSYDSECSSTMREDGKSICFKKLKKVGDPYLLYDHIVQKYAGVKFPVALTEKRFINCNEINNTVDIEVKQQNQDTEYMEANEKTMPVPDGWEFDRIDERGNIVLKEKKKELPKTWLECLKCVNDLDMIDTGDNIKKWNFATLDGKGYVFGRNEHNLLPCGLGKSMLALCQLLVCRNAWWKQLGWKPDWNDRKSLKHCIHSDGYSTTDITQHSTFPRILAFPTEDTAIKFRNTFKNLIEEAKELL